MQKTSLTIIIPVYNAAKYLPALLHQITGQMDDKDELIVIDDASTDDSVTVATSIISTHSNCHLIEKSYNRGVSNSRNIGIELAKGDYIIFLDADDRVQDNALENYRNGIVKSQNSDVIVTGAIEENHVTKKCRNLILPWSGSFGAREIVQMVDRNSKTTLFNYIWCKAYSKVYLHSMNIRFNEELSLGEDFLFNLECIQKGAVCWFTSEITYYWIKRGATTLSGRYLDKELDRRRLIDSSFYELLKYYDRADAYEFSQVCAGEMAINSLAKICTRGNVEYEDRRQQLVDFHKSEYNSAINAYRNVVKENLIHRVQNDLFKYELYYLFILCHRIKANVLKVIGTIGSLYE